MALACVRVIAGLVWLSFGLAACGGSQTAPPTKPRVCTPGTVYECVHGSCNGHQSCMSDGSDFTSCVCDPATTEVAGKGANMISDAGTHTAGDAGRRDASASDAGKLLGAEQCDNGRDDDGDGKVDCADDDCASMACVAEAPSGWHGPVALAEGAPDPSCSGVLDKTAFEAGANPMGDAASCTSCTCSPAGNGCTSFIDFSTGDTAACGGTTCTTSVNQKCTEITPPCLNGLSTAYLKTKLPAADGCTPSTSTATKNEASFEKHALACASSAAQRGGCKTGNVCLPAAAATGFEPGYCVWKDGDVNCPSGSFSDKRMYYRELTDTRACSACSCGGGNCSYKWQIFGAGDTACATPILELTNPNECVGVNPSSGKLRVGAVIAGDGACTPAGGMSEGSVGASKPITVCCSG